MCVFCVYVYWLHDRVSEDTWAGGGGGGRRGEHMKAREPERQVPPRVRVQTQLGLIIFTQTIIT